MNLTKLFNDDIDELAVVVAFDPGETTGWCLMGVIPEDLSMQQGNAMGLHQVIKHMEYGQIDGRATGENLAADDIIRLAVCHPKAAVITEDFILDFKQATSDRHTLAPVRMNAILDYEMYRNDRNVIVQGRSGVKTTCTDLRLKHWNLYDSRSGPHARDATRHAFYWLRCCRGGSIAAQENRWRAWPHLFPDPYDTAKRDGVIAVAKRQRDLGERI